GSLVLASDVDVRGGVIADEDGREPELAQAADLAGDLFLDPRRERAAVHQRRGHPRGYATGSCTSLTSSPSDWASLMPVSMSSRSRCTSTERIAPPMKARSFGRQSACSTKVGRSRFAASTSRRLVFAVAFLSRTRS